MTANLVILSQKWPTSCREWKAISDFADGELSCWPWHFKINPVENATFYSGQCLIAPRIGSGRRSARKSELWFLHPNFIQNFETTSEHLPLWIRRADALQTRLIRNFTVSSVWNFKFLWNLPKFGSWLPFSSERTLKGRPCGSVASNIPGDSEQIKPKSWSRKGCADLKVPRTVRALLPSRYWSFQFKASSVIPQ